MVCTIIKHHYAFDQYSSLFTMENHHDMAGSPVAIAGCIPSLICWISHVVRPAAAMRSGRSRLLQAGSVSTGWSETDLWWSLDVTNVFQWHSFAWFMLYRWWHASYYGDLDWCMDLFQVWICSWIYLVIIAVGGYGCTVFLYASLRVRHDHIAVVVYADI